MATLLQRSTTTAELSHGTMSSDLLKREREFRALNEGLQRRAQQLLSEADSVMNLHKYVPQAAEEERAPAESPAPCGALPEDCQNMGQKALMQFLKSKVTLLQNDVDVFRMKYKSKHNEMKQLELEYERLQEDRNKWKRTAQVNKDHKDKLSNQLTTAIAKVQAKDAQIASLKRENEALQKDLKGLNANNSNQDLRLNKALEDLEKVKANLKNAKKLEKDLRETHRKETAELSKLNKRLDKQTTELISGFKKQLLLIDNLKKQKIYLESTKITDMIEEEFLKVLDWKPDSTST